MKRFNCHVHTDVSPDCSISCDAMAKSAVAAGLNGIAITDHCAGSGYISYNSYQKAKKSVKNAARLAEEYKGTLEIFKGVEFEEMLWSPEYIQRIIDSTDFDIVLASVHKARKCPTQKFFSRIDFSKFSQEDIYTYASWYLDDVYETAMKCDFDVLAHLTIVERYIKVKYGRDIDFQHFQDKIDAILKVLISRDKALEVNTSEIYNIGLMPGAEILKRYHSLGGELITIGTDAHKPDKIAHGFDDAVAILKECGFKYYVYYKKRKPYKEYFD